VIVKAYGVQDINMGVPFVRSKMTNKPSDYAVRAADEISGEHLGDPEISADKMANIIEKHIPKVKQLAFDCGECSTLFGRYTTHEVKQNLWKCKFTPWLLLTSTIRPEWYGATEAEVIVAAQAHFVELVNTCMETGDGNR